MGQTISIAHVGTGTSFKENGVVLVTINHERIGAGMRSTIASIIVLPGTGLVSVGA
jgi:hypothetical protein